MISVSHILDQYYKTKTYETRPVLPIPDSTVLCSNLQRPNTQEGFLRQPEHYPDLERLERIEEIVQAEFEIGILAGQNTAT